MHARYEMCIYFVPGLLLSCNYADLLLSVGDNVYMKVYIVAIASLRRKRDIRKA